MIDARAPGFALAAALLACACGVTSRHWIKEDSDPVQTSRDLEACRQALVSFDQRASVSPTGFPGQPSTSPVLDQERQTRDFQSTQRCMWEKGYRLESGFKDAGAQ